MDAAFLVYAISDKASFSRVPDWLKALRETAPSDVIITLVGNKCDLVGQRTVPALEAHNFAVNNNLSFIETSADCNLYVETLFFDVFKKLLHKRSNPSPVPFKAIGLKHDKRLVQAESILYTTAHGAETSSLVSKPTETFQASVLPSIDDDDLDFPRVSEWLQSVDKSKRGRDGQNFVQYARALEAAGYLRIDSLDNPARVTEQTLVGITGMLPGYAANILKWVVVDITKLRLQAQRSKLDVSLS